MADLLPNVEYEMSEKGVKLTHKNGYASTMISWALLRALLDNEAIQSMLHLKTDQSGVWPVAKGKNERKD